MLMGINYYTIHERKKTKLYIAPQIQTPAVTKTAKYTGYSLVEMQTFDTNTCNQFIHILSCT